MYRLPRTRGVASCLIRSILESENALW